MRKVVSVIFLTLLAAIPARAGTVTIDFEALPNLANASAYLASFGVTVVDAGANKGLVVFDETFTYGGGVVNAPSGTKYVTQAAIDALGNGTGGAAVPIPNSFTLNFSSALDSFGFSSIAVTACSINSPWSATAYAGLGATGSVLASASQSPGCVFPTTSYLLAGAGIQSVKFIQTPSSNAAFYAANLDDFVLTGPGVGVPVPAPATALMLLLGLVPGLGAHRSRRNRPRPC